MNYKLIMTEGNDELALMNILLDKGLLKSSKEELLAEKVFQRRQIDGEIQFYIQMLPNEDDVDIYRVGDKLSDTLKIPQSILSSKIRNKYDICTLPEFEILFILNEGLYASYEKQKSSLKPSAFYMKCNSAYKKQSKFVNEYFGSMSNKEIRKLIDLYVQKRIKTHKKGQGSLKDLMIF